MSEPAPLLVSVPTAEALRLIWQDLEKITVEIRCTRLGTDTMILTKADMASLVKGYEGRVAMLYAVFKAKFRTLRLPQTFLEAMKKEGEKSHAKKT